MTARGFSEITLDTPVTDAWAAIVSPERHRWYYRLTPQGEFAVGQTIRWVDATGAAAEESEVVELDPPRRLVMRTRFLYAPSFASQPQHTLTWDVARKGRAAE